MKSRSRSVSAAILFPPGPQRREVNLLASSLFAATGDHLCLALPDLVVLTVGRAGANAEVTLRNAWSGIEGSFSCASLERRGDSLFLPVRGPLPDLARAAAACFEAPQPFPFEGGCGFFLGGEKAAAFAEEKAPTLSGFGWRACRLALVDVQGDLDGLTNLTWSERASVWRPSARRADNPSGEGPSR